MDKTEEILTRGVANIIPNKEELKKELKSGRRLNIYLGIDPTAPQIHLGHAVPLRKLQSFAELGHNVTLVIGDFTALIGDTSDKDTERPALTSEQINQNMQTYKNQAEKILDFSKIHIRHNREWLKELSFAKIIKLTQHFSVGDFVGRELIRKRLDEGKRVGLHEFLYPIMQGYDSYALDTDIQIGGTDQTFNMQAGRILQKNLHNKQSFVLANVFLEGTDGRKMSKTWGNAIWLNDEPNDMYAKVMSVRDDLIIQYFTLATNITMEEIKNIEEDLNSEANPMDVKKRLAFEIIKELHNKEAAEKSAKNFEKTIQQKELPSDIQLLNVNTHEEISFVDILVNSDLAESKSEARRLIEQGGVIYNNVKIENPSDTFVPEDNAILQVGRRRFVKVKITN